MPLGITCEERVSAPGQLTDLQPGDLLVTLSTHTLGWRHGHAALVIDHETVLEAAMPGTVSGFSSPTSWATYSSLLHLRVRSATAQQQTAAADFARAHLAGLPYGFFSGLGTEKAPPSPRSLQCAYLPWYAWQSQGVDLDGDGGRLVTVMDLTQSPQLEVIQAWGCLLKTNDRRKTAVIGFCNTSNLAHGQLNKPHTLQGARHLRLGDIQMAGIAVFTQFH